MDEASKKFDARIDYYEAWAMLKDAGREMKKAEFRFRVARSAVDELCKSHGRKTTRE